MLPRYVDTIVVPLDGSRFAQHALPIAARLARRLDAAVHLLSAVPERAELASRLEQLANLELRDVRVAHSVVVDPDPADAIEATLERFDGGIGCMASHGRNRSAALIGSVTNEVIRRRRDPIVVVGPFVDRLPAGDAEDRETGVVACVDDTPAADAILPVALWWAELLRERPVVLTVAEPVPPPLDDQAPHRRFGPDGDPEAYLEHLVSQAPVDSREIETRVVYDPVSPAAGIRDHVRDHPASLLVLGSRARTGVARLALGSVAAEVVHGSVSPVLLAPRADATIHPRSATVPTHSEAG
jgi:nucleotide-binding universal stress UspA family protein